MNTPRSDATFAAKVNYFNETLAFTAPLPPDIAVMNPFRENDCATPASRYFYDKFYDDYNKRGMILGINPGRFGAGITGVPFTDPNHLKKDCGIDLASCPKAREPSSDFVYDVINLYGGVAEFYRNWYINSLCPLGFTRTNAAGKPVNYNYYDNRELEKAVLPFIIRTLRQQIDFGIHTEVCICMGTGKNYIFMDKLNRKEKFFGKIIPLEHPRYIMQYKSKEKGAYCQKYLTCLRDCEKIFAG